MPMPSVSIIDTLKPKTTDLKANQIGQNWSEKIRTQSAFSARTTEQSYVDELKRRLMAVAGNEETPQVAQRKLQATLAKIGYTPDGGFPNAPGVAVGAKGSITDLSSEARLRLIMKTNCQQARSMGQMSASQSPILRTLRPAWRLTRTGWRREPRDDWKERWQAAGDAVGWQGAVSTQFVALKNSPIWDALGAGAGGFKDTLHEAYPPFAYGSGMAWVHVSRKEAIALGLDVSDGAPTREEINDYVEKRDSGELDPRDLPSKMPEKYTDTPFSFNPNALKTAQQAISTAIATVKAARTALDATEAKAQAKYTLASETLENAKNAALSVDTNSLEVAVQTAKDAIAARRAEIDAVESSLNTLSAHLSGLAIPTNKAEQTAYNAQCESIKDAAKQYADKLNVKFGGADTVALIDTAIKAVEENVKNGIVGLSSELMLENLKAFEALKARSDPEREYHKALNARFTKVSKRVEGLRDKAKKRVESAGQAADAAEDAAHKEFEKLRSLLLRAKKETSALAGESEKQLADNPTKETADNARKQFYALRSSWADKINARLNEYTASLNRFETSIREYSDAITEAEKYVFEFNPAARDAALKSIAASIADIEKCAKKVEAEEATQTANIKNAQDELNAVLRESFKVANAGNYKAQYTSYLSQFGNYKSEIEKCGLSVDSLKQTIEQMKEAESEEDQKRYDKQCADIAEQCKGILNDASVLTIEATHKFVKDINRTINDQKNDVGFALVSAVSQIRRNIDIAADVSVVNDECDKAETDRGSLDARADAFESAVNSI